MRPISHIDKRKLSIGQKNDASNVNKRSTVVDTKLLRSKSQGGKELNINKRVTDNGNAVVGHRGFVGEQQ